MKISLSDAFTYLKKLEWVEAVVYSIAINIVVLQLLGNFISISILSYLTVLIIIFTIFVSIRYCQKSVGLGLILLSSIWLVFPFFYQFPHGFDPWGHLFLIDKISDTNLLITDWMPLEEIPLNYPTGIHALLASYSKITGLLSPFVFKWFFAWCGFLTSLFIYLFYSRIFGENVGRYSSYVYTFLTFYGSLHYLTWGGLPNALAMLFFLVSLDCFYSKNRTMFVLLFITIIFTHHNTMFFASLFYSCLLIVLIISKKRDWEKIKNIFVMFLLSSPLLMNFLLRSKDFKFTGMDVYKEPLLNFTRIFNNYSWSFWPIIIIGLIITYRKKIRFPLEIKLIMALLSVFFVLFEYVGRYFTKKFLGQEIAYMAPSRFLTNLSYFLCLFGGFFFSELISTFRIGKKIVVASLTILAVSNYYQIKKIVWEQVDFDFVSAYSWIKENTNINSRIIAGHTYSSYFSQRVSSSPLIPSSELWKLMKNHHNLMMDAKSSSPHTSPIYIVTSAEMGLKIVYQKGNVKVYQLY